eukprot:TRINITY_DN9548_c0_g1_i1.p1 TRINITY_DN9548_c0_g1~~TRINITY_DN9548_c0_g1_i1.p1  ORF type:complete len:504 (+),score=123.33 TRINITY_DN9548_c0_g1_i1:71-1582(+)
MNRQKSRVANPLNDSYIEESIEESISEHVGEASIPAYSITFEDDTFDADASSQSTQSIETNADPTKSISDRSQTANSNSDPSSSSSLSSSFSTSSSIKSSTIRRSDLESSTSTISSSSIHPSHHEKRPQEKAKHLGSIHSAARRASMSHASSNPYNDSFESISSSTTNTNTNSSSRTESSKSDGASTKSPNTSNISASTPSNFKSPKMKKLSYETNSDHPRIIQLQIVPSLESPPTHADWLRLLQSSITDRARIHSAVPRPKSNIFQSNVLTESEMTDQYPWLQPHPRSTEPPQRAKDTFEYISLDDEYDTQHDIYLEAPRNMNENSRERLYSDELEQPIGDAFDEPYLYTGAEISEQDSLQNDILYDRLREAIKQDCQSSLGFRQEDYKDSGFDKLPTREEITIPSNHEAVLSDKIIFDLITELLHSNQNMEQAEWLERSYNPQYRSPVWMERTISSQAATRIDRNAARTLIESQIAELLQRPKIQQAVIAAALKRLRELNE